MGIRHFYFEMRVRADDLDGRFPAILQGEMNDDEIIIRTIDDEVEKEISIVILDRAQCRVLANALLAMAEVRK